MGNDLFNSRLKSSHVRQKPPQSVWSSTHPNFSTCKIACPQVDFLLNGNAVDELTMICHSSRARDTARRVCQKLQESIPRQQFGIIIQGAVGSKILAREDIRPYRKDVTAKCVRNLCVAWSEYSAFPMF